MFPEQPKIKYYNKAQCKNAFLMATLSPVLLKSHIGFLS